MNTEILAEDMPGFLHREPTPAGSVEVLPPTRELVMPNRGRLDAIVDEVRQLHVDVQQGLRLALPKAMLIGELLIEAKAKLPHGRWLPWVQDHCGFGPKMAQKYLRIYKHRDQLRNGERVIHLGIASALKSIAKPRRLASRPRPACKTEPKIDDIADKIAAAGLDLPVLAMKHAQRIAVGRTADALQAYVDAFNAHMRLLISARLP